MMTILESNVLSPIDWYLIEPIGPNIIDFCSIGPPGSTEDLLKTYGRFWISNDGILRYRQPQCLNGKDTIVKNITVGHCLGDGFIVRVNGKVIPTIALEQLRILLCSCQKCQFNVYSPLLHNLNSHRLNINRTIR